MAATITAYDHFWRLTKVGGLDLSQADLRVRMVSSDYQFDPGHTAWNNGVSDSTNPSSAEVPAGDGYVLGGKPLQNPVITNSSITYDDIVWENLTKTFRALVCVAVGTFDGVTDPLIFYLLPDSTPADIVSSGSNYTIVWNTSDGVFYRPSP
jgi:hypothetical protein